MQQLIVKIIVLSTFAETGKSACAVKLIRLIEYHQKKVSIKLLTDPVKPGLFYKHLTNSLTESPVTSKLYELRS